MSNHAAAALGSDRLLLVDDDPDHLELVARYIAPLGLEYVALADSAAALERVQNEKFTIVITDMVMPEVDGMQLLHHIKAFVPDTDVIVMTGYSKKYSYTEVIGCGASDFIEKPFKRDELIAKLNRLRQERCLIQELRRAQQVAEEANQAKTNFLNTISHEFRTPMNGIVGFSYLLRGTELSTSQQEYLRMIDESAQRLHHLINQVFDFSMLEASAKDLQPNHFKLSPFLAELHSRHTERLQEKNLELTISLGDGIADKLWFGDQIAIGQLFDNLLDNAITYTSQGRITISGQIEKVLATNKYLLHFSIADSGCGIEEKKQEVIFQPFAQAEEYLTRRHEGAGLGLAICTKLVSLMGGEIWVESKVGAGSTFHFTLQADLA